MQQTRARALALLVAVALVAALSGGARATVQEESCIEPDIEYPVPCDDDED